MSARTNSDSGNASQPATAPTFDDVRDIVTRELRADNLSKAEQDTLMQQVGEALWERATFALMKNVPLEVFVEMSEAKKDPKNPADIAFFMQRISQHVPNAQDIIVNAIKAGLADYQEYLDKELAKSGQS